MTRILAAAALFILASHAQAQGDAQQIGNQLDQRLFGAYNTCDLAGFGALLAPDIEFYHDQGGLMIGRPQVVAAVEKNICGKVRRELVEGSLHSFPMQSYGLVQTGEHRFCAINTGRCDGTARFIHLWQNTHGTWQATRIISYDHQPR